MHIKKLLTASALTALTSFTAVAEETPIITQPCIALGNIIGEEITGFNQVDQHVQQHDNASEIIELGATYIETIEGMLPTFQRVCAQYDPVTLYGRRAQEWALDESILGAARSHYPSTPTVPAQ